MDSKIMDSKIMDSKIMDSKIMDSEIMDPEIMDSEIMGTEIMGTEERFMFGTDRQLIESDRLYTVPELAPLLRLKPRTLRKYCCERVFPRAFKLPGGAWRVLGADVLALCPEAPLALKPS